MTTSRKSKLFDKEEEKIIKALENKEYKSISKAELSARKEELKLKAKETLKKIRKPISFKPDPSVLSAFKEKAEVEGLPYQTLLNFLMKQYVDGNFKLKIVNQKNLHK